MSKSISLTINAYIAGFLDGDGSIYVRAKPNPTYRYGFQIAPYVVFFQSEKSQEQFAKICKMIGGGYLRVRNDGILEYIVNKIDAIKKLLIAVHPFIVLKRKQIELMLKIIEQKATVKNEKDFKLLLELVDSYRELNYSKKRKKRTLTL
ncbi:MAG: LAGLIDADG homing endonuclease [Candidatus Collierbacteria bacterium GW2011_GWC2_44_13]|nr:MAG: LAGLIDADG homing endonuclease [Candidatus Collierbacteria bacterium GW2011_GWC2_44_13]